MAYHDQIGLTSAAAAAVGGIDLSSDKAVSSAMGTAAQPAHELESSLPLLRIGASERHADSRDRKRKRSGIEWKQIKYYGDRWNRQGFAVTERKI
jgi:hypothetical protein